MHKKVVLLIGNDSTFDEVLMRQIEAAGYMCLWEKDSSLGVNTLKSVRPDLLLLDLVMPITTGHQVLEVINADESLRVIPVMVVANSSESLEIQNFLDLGVKDLVVKVHCTLEEIISKIRGIIGTTQVVPTENIVTKSVSETKILIIEDDAILSEIASDRFRFAGFQVSTASTGLEGLDKAKEIIPDLILLDVIMPGMNGFTVLRLAKEDTRLKEIPIVIFSNLAQEKDFAEGRRLGAADFLVKANFTPSQLVERAKQILGKQ